MITIMQKSHTVKQSEIQLTKNILIKTLGPWKLILWFRKPRSFICIMSVYIYTCINLSYDDIGFKEVFFFLEVLVKHLSNGFGYTTISYYKSWRWYKSGSIHHCICAIALYLVPPQLATAQFTRSFIKFRLKLNIKIPVIVNPLQID